MAISHDSPIQDTAEGVVLTIHVQPNAARSNFLGLHGDALKIRIAAPPVDGEANEALRRFLSEHFKVPVSHVILRAGHNGRRKRVLIKGVTRQQAAHVLKL